MPVANDVKGKVFRHGSAVFMARVVNATAQTINQASVSGIERWSLVHRRDQRLGNRLNQRSLILWHRCHISSSLAGTRKIGPTNS